MLHKSWIAGLIEGDGCFRIDRKKYPRMQIKLIKWDKDILYQIKDSLGGIGGGIINIDRSNQRKKGINATDMVYYSINSKKDYAILLDILEEEKRNRDWLNYWAGFICAEGCFLISLAKDIRCKYDFLISPRFSVKQNNKRTLEDLQQFLNYGNIFKDVDCWKLQIDNLPNCLKISELFTGYIHSVKHKDFVTWQHILKMIVNKKHLTKKGILRIARLKKDMNIRCKSKWTPEKIKEYWNHNINGGDR